MEKILGELDAGVDRAHDEDLAALGDGELDAAVQELAAVQARLDALEAKVLGEWDRRRRWAYHGAKSPAAYLAATRRLPIEACRRGPRVARGLRPLPAVLAALAAGAIELPHVQRILGADNARTHDALVADQVELTRWAMELRWGPFCRRLQDWLDEHDPDGADPGGTETNRFHCSKTIGDRWILDGSLDSVGGSIFAAELDRLERELFEADWKAAKARLGFDPLIGDLERTPEQRRAAALILMAERSAVLPGDGRRGRVLVTVLTGHESLRRILELTNGIQLRPGQVVEHLPAASFEHVLFDSPIHVVGISTQRTFRGLIRKAVQVAHRHCDHPTCAEPIDRCQVDHIKPSAEGGITCQENGRLLCGFHNRARNKRGPPDDKAA